MRPQHSGVHRVALTAATARTTVGATTHRPGPSRSHRDRHRWICPERSSTISGSRVVATKTPTRRHPRSCRPNQRNPIILNRQTTVTTTTNVASTGALLPFCSNTLWISPRHRAYYWKVPLRTEPYTPTPPLVSYVSFPVTRPTSRRPPKHTARWLRPFAPWLGTRPT